MDIIDNPPTYTKCPRCECGLLTWIEGEEKEPYNSSLSRATRDEGARVFVCNDCGEREAIVQLMLGRVAALKYWPLSLEELAAEDQVWREVARAGSIENVDLEDLEINEDAA